MGRNNGNGVLLLMGEITLGLFFTFFLSPMLVGIVLMLAIFFSKAVIKEEEGNIVIPILILAAMIMLPLSFFTLTAIIGLL